MATGSNYSVSGRHYSPMAQAEDGFPFDGYERVLDVVVHAAGASAGMRVLDVGTGTGNLAERFLRQS
jgi:ubiquinone/menaquinone biosynthesis C-methylase UbiE